MEKNTNTEQLKNYFAIHHTLHAELRNEIGTKLCNIRKSNGLTQQEVADIIEISRTSLSNYEKGERVIDIEVLYKLCNLYNVSIDYLVGLKNTPDTQHEYRTIDNLKFFGFTNEAICVMAEAPDSVQLFNDLVLHPSFRELTFLTHYSRSTRFEGIDNNYRAFLTEKLLYSMMCDIYKDWYINNDAPIINLSDKEKQEILTSIEKYRNKKEKFDKLADSDSIYYFEHFKEMQEELEMLYRKLKKHI